MGKIIGLGNALTDVLIRLDSEQLLADLHLPKGGMQLIDAAQYEALQRHIEVMPHEMATGGSAANTALCVASLEGEAGFIGKANTDERIGQFFQSTFRAQGVHLTLVPSGADLSSGVATTFITRDGERTFATYLGAAAELRAEELTAEMFAGASVVHIEGYLVTNHALILRAMELAHAAGAEVSLDMASFNVVASEHEFFKTLLAQTDIVFANKEEAAAWGEPLGLTFEGEEPRSIMADLASRCKVAVVKVGKLGAWAQCGNQIEYCPSVGKGAVVDTTAAGDFFAAGFLHNYVRERSLQECLQAGALCSNRVIQVVGTKLPETTWQDLRTLINK